VYIEEIPSGVRTILGVATSITAFFGRANQGPVDEPVTINNFGDYERIFGGLSTDSPMSFAVRDFYLNGGATALIVRLTNGAATATFDMTDLAPTPTVLLGLEAASQGVWANTLQVELTNDVSQDVADRFGVTTADLFNLEITDTATGVSETHRNLTVVESPRRVDRVLEQSSALMRVRSNVPLLSAPPPPQTATVDVPGDDGLDLDDAAYLGDRAAKTGIFALEDADLFNLVVIPPYAFGTDVSPQVWAAAAAYAAERRAMVIVDPPASWTTKQAAKDGLASLTSVIGSNKKNSALFFPRLRQPNPLRDNQLESFVPGGAAAGVFARTDTQRGVWKAPAGLEANLNGVPLLSVPLSDAENGELNPLGINALRTRPAAGNVIWGSRTLDGDDRLASEWKYIPVRRVALFIEESLFRGTQFAVFEPNDEPLWAQLRVNIGAFMQNLFRQGAFQGQSRDEAYFVKVDRETTTQNDIDRGIVNIVVGFAPLKPAEFVIIKLQQIAGQIEA
jgi:phage tail sheath protein FI